MTRFLEEPPSSFSNVYQEVAAFSLPDGSTAKVIKRTHPLTTDASIQLYEEALKAVPHDVTLYEELGVLYLRTGNLPRAEELLLQAARIDPLLGSPYRALGDLYHSQALGVQAIGAYREANVPCSAVGRTEPGPRVEVQIEGMAVLSSDIRSLRDTWEETSSRLDRLQANPECVEQERAGLLRAALEELPRHYRDVIFLVYVEGMKIDEAARTLHLPQGTIKTRLMRGREGLRRILIRKHPDHFGGQHALP